MAINIFKKDEKAAAKNQAEAASDSKKAKKALAPAEKSTGRVGLTAAAARILRGAHITEKRRVWRMPINMFSKSRPVSIRPRLPRLSKEATRLRLPE